MAQETMSPLHQGSGCYVPKNVAVCPECGRELTARAMQWDAETGLPHASAIEIQCSNEWEGEWWRHTWRQSDWQPVRDRIAEWSKAVRE
jgi:hypothetical protein